MNAVHIIPQFSLKPLALTGTSVNYNLIISNGVAKFKCLVESSDLSDFVYFQSYALASLNLLDVICLTIITYSFIGG